MPPEPLETLATLPERRALRSDDPLIALGRMLDATRRSSGSKTLAIADESGLLVAGSGYFSQCEELAALAAGAPDAASSAQAAVRRAAVRGVQILVCVEGGDAERALSAATSGALRILSPRTARRR